MPEKTKEAIGTILQVAALIFAFALVFYRSTENTQRGKDMETRMRIVENYVARIDTKMDFLVEKAR